MVDREYYDPRRAGPSATERPDLSGPLSSCDLVFHPLTSSKLLLVEGWLAFVAGSLLSLSVFLDWTASGHTAFSGFQLGWPGQMLLALGVLTAAAGVCALVCDDGRPALICFPTAIISVALAIWLFPALFQGYKVQAFGDEFVAKGFRLGPVLFTLSTFLIFFAGLWAIGPHCGRKRKV